MTDKEKYINRIITTRKLRDSEISIGNEGVVENFDNLIQKWMDKFSITESDIQSVLNLQSKNEIKVEIINELGKNIVTNPYSKSDLNWFNELAKVVANGFHCIANPRLGKNEIAFYGYDLDRELCIYFFEKLGEIVNRNCNIKIDEVKSSVGSFDFKSGKVNLEEWVGDDVFIESYHSGFRYSIRKEYDKHERDGKKIQDVAIYFESNKNDDFDWRYTHGSIGSTSSVPEVNYNQYVFELGQKMGQIALKKSTKSDNGLIQKKSSSLQKRNNNVVDLNKHTVFLLIDRSGSMSGYRLEQAKLGAIDYVNGAIDKGYNVGVIAFGSRIDIVSKPTSNIKHLEKAINKIRIEGLTHMADAIKAAKMYFTSRRFNRTIMIVTDGNPSGANNSPDITLQVANDCKREGIEIQCIGVEGANQDFIDKLVSKEGLGLLVNSSQLRLTMGDMVKRLGA
jgi:uncharacterized protein YegL